MLSKNGSSDEPCGVSDIFPGAEVIDYFWSLFSTL